MSNSTSDDRIPILYLLTDEISSVLVRGQLGYLIDHGFDVTVGTRRSEPDTPPAPGKWDDGVVVEHVPFVREPSPLSDLRALWATIRLIRRVRPTIVNASTPKAGLLGMLAAWLCRVKVRVYVVRGFRFETMTGWRRRLLVSLEWIAARCANQVIFNSHSLLAVGQAEDIVRSGRGQVLGAGSGNGIDVARFADDRLPSRAAAREQFGLPADAPVIGFVGRFTKDKGIEDLIDVFTSLAPPSPEPGGHRARDEFTRTADAAAEVREPWLLLVGQFEDGNPISVCARRAIETHPRIMVIPWLEHTGVAYQAMDVLAFPSYREGMPNVPLEAQLCGVPVVGYAATGTVDAVAGVGRNALVAVSDTQALGEAITRALQGRLAATAVCSSTAAEIWVRKQFASERLWSSLDDLYRDASAVVSEPGRTR